MQSKKIRGWMKAAALPGLLLLPLIHVNAQSNLPREVTILTYQRGADFQVSLTSTSRVPNLRGWMVVEKSKREGTAIKLSVHGLPSVLNLGGLYTTYVVWAIAPNGTPSILGTLPTTSKEKGTTDSTGDFETPLSSFAVVISAEPFSKVLMPSPAILLESKIAEESQMRRGGVSTTRFETNPSDFFRDERVAGAEEKSFRRTSLPLLRAKRAVEYARFANADYLADAEFKKASGKFSELEGKPVKQMNERELDRLVEEIEILVETAVMQAEKARRIKKDQQVNTQIKTQLEDAEERSSHYKNLYESANQELKQEERRSHDLEQDLKKETSRREQLEKDNATFRYEKAQIQAKLELAEAMNLRLQKKLEAHAELYILKQHFKGYADVQDIRGGLIIKLPEAIWRPNSAELNELQTKRFDDVLATVARRSEFDVTVTVTTEAADTAQLAISEQRLTALSDWLKIYGIEPGRVKFENLSKVSQQTGSRRSKGLKSVTEIKLSLIGE